MAMFRTAIGLLVVGVFCLAPQSPAQDEAKRQSWGPWKKHSTKPYYYRSYFYKKSPTDKEYSYHYGIYHPSRGKRVYMFNPQKKTYWGYWEGGQYSILPKEKRKESLDDIAAEDFPKPGNGPPIPETDDGSVMDAPPNDFPSLDDKP
jgi:hypothetical protein